MKSIEECLTSCESLIAEQKAQGGKLLWSPRLVEALKYLTKRICGSKRIVVERILNG